MGAVFRMEQFEQIRRDREREGLSIRGLAERHGVHRRAVRQALASPLPPVKRSPVGRPAPRLGPYRPLIDAWLEGDREAPRKQRHTAKRIWQRLVDEHGAEVAETTVRDYVRMRKRAMGWPVWVETFVARERLRGDAADAASAWTGDIYELGKSERNAQLVVDALFGAGLSRPLEGEAARLAVLTPASRVVAVDVPSGLKGNDGNPLGDVCFEAALTVTFVRKKPAHVLMPGREWCGEVVVADIGAPENVVAAQNIALFENDPALWSMPWPEADTHKHERGHVIVASGGHTRTGAARLSARSALRVATAATVSPAARTSRAWISRPAIP